MFCRKTRKPHLIKLTKQERIKTVTEQCALCDAQGNAALHIYLIMTVQYLHSATEFRYLEKFPIYSIWYSDTYLNSATSTLTKTLK